MNFIALDSLEQANNNKVEFSIPKKISDYISKEIGEDAVIEEMKRGNDTIGYTINSGSQEYRLYLKFEEAEKDAIEQVERQLQDEPENFTQSWIQQFIYIGDTDKRVFIAEEIDYRRTDLLFQIDNEDYYWIESEMEAHKEDRKKYKTEEDFAKAMIEVNLEKVEKELEKDLENPIKYFVEEQGSYTLEELMKADFILIDVKKAAKDAIKQDGVGHFLSSYDGNIDEIDGVGHLVRLN
jgi:hypothetical protein